MKVPFLELKKQNLQYEEELKKVFSDFLDTGHYILGKNVESFEKDFARYCSAKYCIGVANGLDALELILQAFDFPVNGEVIVPANTYFATILSIMNQGLKPILVEPDITNYLINCQIIESFITEKTVAILAVNLYGKMCDFTYLSKLCQKHSLKLLVDAAQSHGAEQNGVRDCYGADAVAYSFYPTKNLGALSDAGAVVTNHRQIAEKIYSLRNYGSSIKYHFEFTGRNSRLSELQAGFLSVKLRHLQEDIENRRWIAHRYLTEIKNSKIFLPSALTWQADAWHLFVIRTPDRERLIKYLKENEVGCDIHYPIAPHKQNALNEEIDVSLPITEEIHDTILSIPLNNTLTDDEVSFVINVLNQYD